MRIHLLLVPLLALATWLHAGEAKAGQAAPPLGSTSSYNWPEGKGIDLSKLKGQAVLIDFWATWCGPCVAAIPHMQELHEKYAKRGLVVIGHTDASSQDLPGFIKKKGITYAISVGADIGNAWGVSGIPHVFLLAPGGQIAWEGHPGGLEDAVVEKALQGARPLGPDAPSFEEPSKSAKVAKLQQQAASGAVGAALTALDKLAAGTGDDATAATAAVAVITAWKEKAEAAIAAAKTDGDVLKACDLAESLAKALGSHAAAKALKDEAAALRKDPAYAAGQAAQPLLGADGATRKDPRFAAAVEKYLKKYPEGHYSDRVRALLKQ